MTPSLVVKYANLEVTHPVCDFFQLSSFEITEARNCLGRSLYQAMLDDLAEYPEATAYLASVSYDAGDTAIYEGTIFRALATTVGNLPVNPDFWELAPRFSTECYNVLFCTVLAPYLAWVVVRHRLPFINTKIAGTGLIKNKSSNFEPAGEHDYNSLLAGASKMVQISWNNLKEFMDDNSDNECYIGFKSFNCPKCGCHKSVCGCSYSGGFVYEFA